MYSPGDFSFVINHKDIFEYDYKVINKMGDIAWNALKNWNDYNYINHIINENLYPSHTAVTYRLSLTNLIDIAKYGWDDFVLNYK